MPVLWKSLPSTRCMGLSSTHQVPGKFHHIPGAWNTSPTTTQLGNTPPPELTNNPQPTAAAVPSALLVPAASTAGSTRKRRPSGRRANAESNEPSEPTSVIQGSAHPNLSSLSSSSFLCINALSFSSQVLVPQHVLPCLVCPTLRPVKDYVYAQCTSFLKYR